MSKSDSIFFSVPGAPTHLTDSEWVTKSEADTDNMHQVRQICADLDYESARQQHLRCGRPLDEPVRSPDWIERQYRVGCAAIGRKWTADLDYPHEARADAEDKREYWATQDGVRSAAEAMASIAKRQQLAAQPRKPKRPAPSAPEELQQQQGAAAGVAMRTLRPKAVPTKVAPGAAQRHAVMAQQQRRMLDDAQGGRAQ